MKQLTGKAKDDFFEWLDKTYPDSNMHGEPSGFSYFNIPQSAQFGLLQEYADTLGYAIDTTKRTWFVDNDITIYDHGYSVSRPEAQVAAIERLNEIINKS